MKKLSVSVLAVLACAAFAASALADPPSPENPAGREMLGVVPAHGFAGNKHNSSGSNLSWHGGPVLHGERTYAIYWVPAGYSVSGTYRSIIDGFFGNVAAANSQPGGFTGDTYFSDTQYSDSSGFVSFGTSSFGGSVVDTNAFPASGCSDTVRQTSVCLSDQQLVNEINNVITANSANGWKRDGKSIYFMFTPRGVGSCDAPGSCAFSTYCAYHSSFSSGGTVLYANQPYTGTVSSACGSGQSPNGDSDADSTLNVTSHEHNETITDPLGNAWYDNRGYEDADKCAWTFGTAGGGTSLSYWNQAIGSGHYYLQRNWSNQSSGCVLTGV
jgi:hypothetical protein